MPFKRISRNNLGDEVRRILIKHIKNKGFGETGAMPSEEGLASQLGVSRVTIRDALAALEREGYVIRKHGKGTYANYRVIDIKTPLAPAQEIGKLLKANGYQPTTTVVATYCKPANEEIANVLNIKEGTETLTVEKLFFADGVPAVFCVDTFPMSVIGDVDISELDFNKSVFEIVERKSGLKINYDIAEISPVSADRKLALLLKCQVGSPLLLIEAIEYTEENNPIMLIYEYYYSNFIRFKSLRLTGY